MEKPVRIIETSIVPNCDNTFAITFYGGNNGHPNWCGYLDQIKEIMSTGDKIVVNKLDNDIPDDIWYLSLRVYSKETYKKLIDKYL